MQWPEPLASSPTVSIDAFVLLIHEQLQFLCALSGRIQDAFIGAQSRAGTALRITIELAVCITKRYPGTFRFKQCFFAIWRECGHQPFIILVELSILTSRFGDDAIYHVERNPIGLVEAGRVFWTQVLLGCGGERFGAQSKGQADHYSCFYNHLNLVLHFGARGLRSGAFSERTDLHGEITAGICSCQDKDRFSAFVFLAEPRSLLVYEFDFGPL